MIVTTKNYEKVLEHLKYGGEWGFDTETTGLLQHDRVFSLILSNENDTYYLNFQEYPDLDPIYVLNKESTLRDIHQRILSNTTNTVYIQNAKFDWRMILKEGYDIYANVICTYALERVIKNNYQGKGAYSLKLMALRRGMAKDDKVDDYITKHKLYTDVPVFGKKEPIREKHFDKVPFQIIAPYGETDGKVVLRIGQSQYKKIQEIEAESGNVKSILPLVKNEIRLTRTLVKMEARGILIDVPLVKKAEEYEAQKIEESKKLFLEQTAREYEDSRLLFREVFDAAGEKYPLTEKGNPSFAGDVLALMDTPVAATINKIRYHEKRLGTYYSSFLYYKDKDDIIHANALQAGTATGRMSYTSPNCLSMDTQVLTSNGWMSGETYTKGTAIAVYKDKKLFWEVPSKVYVSDDSTKYITTAKNEHFNMRMTSDHRVHCVDRKSKKEKFRAAKDFPLDAHILHGAPLDGWRAVDPWLLKLYAAIQADGHYTQGNQIEFGLVKRRKQERLISILGNLNIAYRGGFTLGEASCIRIPFIHTNLLEEKKFTFKVLELTSECKKVLFEELKWWDGSSTREEFDYCSIYRQNIDVVQALASCCGYRAHVYRHSNPKSVAWVCSFTRRQYSGTANVEIKEEISTEKVWCVEVSSGAFLARRGDTFITGNCQNIPKEDDEKDQLLPFHVRESFMPRPGHFFYAIDYDQMEYKLMLDYAGEMDLISRVNDGEDLHQATADLVGVTRKQAKTLNFAILYGAGYQNIALMLKLKEHEAQELISRYFAKLPKVEKFIDNVKLYGKQRRYVYNWFGRRMRIASNSEAYKLPNHLIQGGCADIVKIAMNEIDDLLLDKGTKMLLQVHDELLFEVPYGEADIAPRLQSIMNNVYTPKNGMRMTTSLEHSTKNWGFRSKKKGLYVG